MGLVPVTGSLRMPAASAAVSSLRSQALPVFTCAADFGCSEAAAAVPGALFPQARTTDNAHATIGSAKSRDIVTPWRTPGCMP